MRSLLCITTQNSILTTAHSTESMTTLIMTTTSIGTKPTIKLIGTMPQSLETA